MEIGTKAGDTMPPQDHRLEEALTEAAQNLGNFIGQGIHISGYYGKFKIGLWIKPYTLQDVEYEQ